jgi:hypothetical protein
MVVCDGLWRDPYTGKTTILGTFSTIGGSSFPLFHPVLSVYISLTDGHGTVPVRLVLVDVDEERQPIFERTDEIKFTDPRMVMELCIWQGAVVFPEPGEYRLKLIAKDEFIIERRILVVNNEPADVEGEQS